MNNSNNETPLLDEDNASFIQHGVSINVASRDADYAPSMARAYGCRVSADRRQVTVFLSRPTAETVLNDLRNQCVIAAVFSQPDSHRTLQLKATDACIKDLLPGDRDIIAKNKVAFQARIRSIGYADPFVGAMERSVIPDFIAVTFTPATAFIQTPGPNAGRKLGD